MKGIVPNALRSNYSIIIVTESINLQGWPSTTRSTISKTEFRSTFNESLPRKYPRYPRYPRKSLKTYRRQVPFLITIPSLQKAQDPKRSLKPKSPSWKLRGATSLFRLTRARYLPDPVSYDPYLRVTFESLTRLIRDKLIDIYPYQCHHDIDGNEYIVHIM